MCGMADPKMESVRMLSFIELFMFVEIVLDRSATTPVAMAGWRKTDAKLQKRRQIKEYKTLFLYPRKTNL